MKKQHIIILFICFMNFPMLLSAETITKVAVLDYSRILSSYYVDSAEVLRIEEMKKDFAAEIEKLKLEIQSLEQQKLSADDLGDSRKALQLDSQIEDRKQYYRDYIRIRGNQINQASTNLGSSNVMAQEILSVIQYVAETNGFSIVLNRSDPNLLWWGFEVDITELVLKRLMNTQ